MVASEVGVEHLFRVGIRSVGDRAKQLSKMDTGYYGERARSAKAFKERVGVLVVAGNGGFKRQRSFDAKRFKVFAESVVVARCDEIGAGIMGKNAFTFRRFKRNFQR